MPSTRDIPEAEIPPGGDEGRSQEWDAAAFEEANVHGVYSSIAPHFSSTRYKPWPLIPLFLATLPPNSLGADVGTGNGKYLHIESAFVDPKGKGKEAGKAIVMLGVDRSRELLELAQYNDGRTASAPPQAAAETSKGKMTNEVIVGDAIASGLRYSAFDFAISIATIHHLSTFERRRRSVEEMIRLVKPVAGPSKLQSLTPLPSAGPSTDAPQLSSGPGRFLIFVWALEQRHEGKRTFEAGDGEAAAAEERQQQQRQEGKEAKGRDLLVPWVFAEPESRKSQQKKGKGKKAEADAKGAEAANEEGQGGDDTEQGQAKEEGKVFHRFYHVFAAGELESLVDSAASHLAETEPSMADVEVHREASGWERGNWWGVWQVSRRSKDDETSSVS